jgi:Ca2+:H+ antiporter
MRLRAKADHEVPRRGIGSRLFSGLLVFVPVSFLLALSGASGTVVFVCACLALMPLAAAMGSATEDLSHHVGTTWGGLLNATFGNATEIIIALLAIRAGLLDVVKATITGSIIGNLLFVVGLAALMGGLKHKIQSFNQHTAGLRSSLLVMSVLALMVPAVFVHAIPGLYAHAGGTSVDARVEHLSFGVSGVLVVVYLLSLFFLLKTHESLLVVGDDPAPTRKASRSPRAALGLLAVSTIAIALESELLVGGISSVTRYLGLNQLFIGVVVIAVVGNAAEHAAAVVFARRNQMDLALNIAVGSSIQIALFVAPLLVFASVALGHPMTLIFNPFELVSIAFAVTITAVISLDGQTHWLEGVLLLAAYIVIALAFYFIPSGATGGGAAKTAAASGARRPMDGSRWGTLCPLRGGAPAFKERYEINECTDS